MSLEEIRAPVVDLDAARRPDARRLTQARREDRAADLAAPSGGERVAMALVGAILADLRPKRRRRAVARLEAKAARIAAAVGQSYAVERWSAAEAATANAIAADLAARSAPAHPPTGPKRPRQSQP